MSLSANFIFGQNAPSFSIKGSKELCRKGDYYEAKEIGSLPPNCKLENVKWEMEDSNGDYQSIGTGETVFVWPGFHSYPTTKRTFKLKAKLTCKVQTAEDDKGDPVYSTQTYGPAPMTITIIDPVYFEVRNLQNISCSNNMVRLEVYDPGGYFTNANLQDVVWTPPSGWNLTSAPGYNPATFNTNGLNRGSKEVKVTFKAQSNKYDALNNRIVKNCGDEREVKATYNFNSCKPIITYPPIASHQSSHSLDQTTIENGNGLSSQDYTIVSGGTIEILNGVDFIASLGVSMDLFIEECNCNSPWHDPNRKGQSTISIANVSNGKQNSFENSENSHFSLQESTVIYNYQQVTVYPNPTKDVLRLGGLLKNSTYEVAILAMDGRIIRSFKIQPKDDYDYELIVSGLRPSLCFLNLVSGNMNFQGRFIVESAKALK